MKEDAAVLDPQEGDSQSSPLPQGGERQEPVGLASLPEWAQEELRLARNEAASRRVKQRETEDRLRRMEEEKLAEQQRWQELAQARQDEIASLKPKADQADALSALLKDQLVSELASWPESVKALAPSSEDPLALLAWVGQAREVVQEMKKKPPVPGNSASPTPTQESVREPASSLVNVRSRF